jgi:hypothetical protein
MISKRIFKQRMCRFSEHNACWCKVSWCTTHYPVALPDCVLPTTWQGQR